MCLGGHLVRSFFLTHPLYNPNNFAQAFRVSTPEIPYVSIREADLNQGRLWSPRPLLCLLLRHWYSQRDTWQRKKWWHSNTGEERCSQRQRRISYDIWKTSALYLRTNLCPSIAIFVIQDTHVPREGRDLIRKTLEDANVATSVRVNYVLEDTSSSYFPVVGGSGPACLYPRRTFQRSMGRSLDKVALLLHDGGLWENHRQGLGSQG
jgi:hypothetical protein